MYTGVVLCVDSVEILSSYRVEGFGCVTPGGDLLPHHMTLNMGRFDVRLNDLVLLGMEVEMLVDAIFYSDDVGACAARVLCARTLCGVELRSVNKFMHITLGLKSGVKPFRSNDLFRGVGLVNCVELLEPLLLRGVVEECF